MVLFQITPKKIKLDPDASIVDIWTRVASKRKQEPALPTPFELPINFQPKIQIGLDENNLTGRTRAKFVTAIAEAMYRFKSYPLKNEYEHVAQQIVKKWTFLEGANGHVSQFFNKVVCHYCCYISGLSCRSTEGTNGVLAQT